MKVLLSAYACLPNAGTEPGHGWGTATNLAKRGLEVHVLTQYENKGRIEVFTSQNLLPGLHFHYLDHSFNRLNNDGLRYLLWQIAAVKRVRGLHQSLQFDIAHHVTYGSFHVPSQLWRIGIPVIFGPVGGGQIALKCMLHYFGADKFKELRRTIFTKLIGHSPFHRYCLRRMSAVLVSNRDTLNLARCLGREDAELLFDTIIPDTFPAHSPRVFDDLSSPLKILWVGRLLPRKGLALSLDILAKVKIPFTLTIVGNGLAPAKVNSMIADRGLTDRVAWQDKRLPWAEVRAAYLSHDVMLFNSLRETGGAQLVEAMALGLPIITLDAQGPRDLVPDAAAVKINVLSANQVILDAAAAIDHFAVLSGAERSQMSTAGWEFSQTLTYGKRSEQLEKLYRRVLARLPVAAEEYVS
jgi:glycosyltransferase involved in cell wall biosynthesis